MGQTQGPISPSSQTLRKVVAAVSDSSGAATWTFPSPPGGYTWTGTVLCPGAPGGSLFAVSVGSTPWGQFGSASVFGPVQIEGTGSEQLVVTGSGLNVSTTYTMYLIGSSDETTYVAPIWPDVTSSALEAQMVGNSITFPPVTFSATTGSTVTQIYASEPLPQTVSGFFIVILAPLQGGPNQWEISVFNNTTSQAFTTRTTNSWQQWETASYPQNTGMYFPVTVKAGEQFVVNLTQTAGFDTIDAIAVMTAYTTSPSVMIQNTPNSALGVVPYGGVQKASVTGLLTTNKVLLAAPINGGSYRLQSISWAGIAAATVTVSGLDSTLPNAPIFTVIGAAAGFQVQYLNLEGLIISGTAINVKASAATPAAQVVVSYDYIPTPSNFFGL